MPKKSTKASHSKKDIDALVERARLDGNRWIRLVDLGLTEFPEQILTVTDVELIEIWGNEIRTLPDRLWDLPKLKHVSLFGNPIETLSSRSEISCYVSIDLNIYLRCRDQIQPQNVNLYLSKDTSEQDVELWLSELEATKGLHYLIIGEWELRLGGHKRKPTAVLQKILSSLDQFDFVEVLSLRGLRLDSVPEGIRQLSWMKIDSAHTCSARRLRTEK